MPIPSALVTKFFHLLVHRRFAEADRELKKVEEKMHKTEWNIGYHKALEGMLAARKSNNENHTFFSKINLNDRKALQKYKREFRSHMNSKLHENFDRGFFAAWDNCMRVLSRMAAESPEIERKKEAAVEKQRGEAAKPPAGSRGQVKIESFLKSKPS